MVVHSCNPNTQQAEARESRVPGQAGLHSKILFQKIKRKKKVMVHGECLTQCLAHGKCSENKEGFYRGGRNIVQT
jgi:hypothetical protein